MTVANGLSRAKQIDRVEQAVLALQDYIVEGRLEPGTPLPSESEMAKQIGVSKFSMREALRVAQSQGLVEIAQGKRTKVADVSIKPAAGVINLMLKRTKHLLLELTEARQSLEISMVEMAAARRTDEQVAAMERNIEEMVAAGEDLARVVDKDIEFHEILAQSSHNRVFELIHESIAGLMRESRQETIAISGVDKPVMEHRRILEAIRAMNRDEAVKCMLSHLDTAALSLAELKE